MPMIAMPMNCAALLASPMGLLASKVGLIPALLGLGLLIAAHEAGHMLVARWMGMRVEVYSLGFGPRMWGFTRGDTEYRVSWFPLGGYCRIAGFTPDDDGKYDDSDPGSYLNKPAWRRFLVILAGPGVNWIAAIFLVGGLYATVGFMEVDPGSTRVEVVPGGPAAAAGMQDGDQLLAVDGVPLHSFEDLIRELHKDGAPAERTVTAQRGAETLSLRVRPESGRIQVGYARERRRLSWLEAAPKAVAVTWELTAGSLSAIGQLFHRGGAASLSGPLGIVQQATLAIKRGAAEFVALLAQISVGLAIFNLLPIPALDGGRLVFLGYEIVLRRRPNAKFEQALSLAGMLALFTLLIGVTLFGDLQLGHKLFGK